MKYLLIIVYVCIVYVLFCTCVYTIILNIQKCTHLCLTRWWGLIIQSYSIPLPYPQPPATYPPPPPLLHCSFCPSHNFIFSVLIMYKINITLHSPFKQMNGSVIFFLCLFKTECILQYLFHLNFITYLSSVLNNKITASVHTVIRFVSISAKFGSCT